MKKFTGLLIVLVIIYVGFNLLKTDNPPKQPSTPVQKQQQATATPEPLTQRNVNATWPYVAGSDVNTTIADSLTQKNFVMVFDGSGSMQKVGCSGSLTKIEAAKQVVTDWSRIVPEDANLGLIVFDRNGFSIRLPLGQRNREQFRTEIKKVIADYKTPLSKSLEVANQMLTEQGQKQLGYGEYTVVIVTDGAANDALRLKQTVDSVLAETPIMIHTMGFCIDSSHTLNTRGRTVYKAANNPDELRQGLQEVLAESESFDISGF